MTHMYVGTHIHKIENRLVLINCSSLLALSTLGLHEAGHSGIDLYNPGTWEVETRGPRVQGQPSLHKILSQKNRSRPNSRGKKKRKRRGREKEETRANGMAQQVKGLAVQA